MKHIKTFVTLFTFFLLALVSAQAAKVQYFMAPANASPAGNGSNDGLALATPLLSINQTRNKAALLPGGPAQNEVTVWMRGGDYYVSLDTYFGAGDSGSLAVTRSGGSLASGGTTLTGSGFSTTDSGKGIVLYGAGAGGTDLFTFVSSYTDATHLVLANANALGSAWTGTYKLGGPIIYRAYNQEKPVIHATVKILASSMTALASNDPRYPQFPVASRGSILVADLAAAGIPASVIQRRAFPSAGIDTSVESFPIYNSVPMTKARFPKASELWVADNTVGTPTKLFGNVWFSSAVQRGQVANNAVAIPDGTTNLRPIVALPSNVATRISGWNFGTPGSSPIWVVGNFDASWQMSVNNVYSFSSPNLTFKFAENTGAGTGGAYGNAFYFENVAEELTEPGEYFLDEAARKIYFRQPSDWTANSYIEVTSPNAGDGCILNVTNCSNVEFWGVTFDGSVNHQIKMRNASDGWAFRNCTFRNSGLNAINSYTPKSLTLDGCDIHHTGTQAVSINNSGSVTSGAITRGNASITNSKIHDSVLRFSTSGLFIAGVGHTVEGCDFFNLPHSAIDIGGSNDLIVRKNRIYNVVQRTCDMGAIYASVNGVFNQGNLIEDNEIHDIGNDCAGRVGTYIDEGTMGFRIQFNRYTRVANATGQNNGPIIVNGGAFNFVEFNSFTECRIPMLFGSYGPSAHGHSWMSSLSAGASNGQWHQADGLDAALAAWNGSNDARLIAYPYLITFFQPSNWTLMNPGAGQYYYPNQTSTFTGNVVSNHGVWPRREGFPGTIVDPVSGAVDACVHDGNKGSLKITNISTK